MSVRTALSLVAAALLSACAALPVARDIPALITGPTEESRAALRQAVSEAFNGIKVTLADDALTKSSLLTIERRPIRDVRGRLLMGRELGMPHQFRLIKNGSRCALVRLSNDRRWVLAGTRCVPEQSLE